MSRRTRRLAREPGDAFRPLAAVGDPAIMAEHVPGSICL